MCWYLHDDWILASCADAPAVFEEKEGNGDHGEGEETEEGSRPADTEGFVHYFLKSAIS